MLECFVSKKFSAESAALIDVMNAIIQSYQAEGYDLSLRQLYYQLVARDLIPNTEQSYKRIGGILSDARLAGDVDWDAIVDRGRSLSANSHWETPGQIVRACAQQFMFNKWADQRYHIEVMVEKQALEGVLEPVCSSLDIGFTANKGYSSSSALYLAGKRIQDKLIDGKEIVVIYLGDHDPSGIDMTRDVEERLRLFSGLDAQYEDGIMATGNYDYEMTVERIALNMDQIKRYKPPPNPTKLTDSRAGGYLKLFGHTCWELDALEPRALAKLVTDTVAQYRDEDLWAEAVEREQKARMILTELAVVADKKAKR